MAQVDTAPAILVREGKGWRQYMVVSDARVAIVHMTPALWEGWKFDRVEIQGPDDWGTLTRDQIVAWKFSGDDGLTKIAPDLGGFRDKLLERAKGDL